MRPLLARVEADVEQLARVLDERRPEGLAPPPPSASPAVKRAAPLLPPTKVKESRIAAQLVQHESQVVLLGSKS